ncbi:MAG: class I SAM-dependent methyltransferase [Eubacterium sp.]|nr:class I SAM-dependent methyltransferase [Eubacterium sp.]
MEIEKVGKVTLDFSCYGGSDLYSDGDVEDKLLSLAKECKKTTGQQIVERELVWPVLYHFSPIRENIVRFLPIKEQADVLEIGSGCGAITGILSKMAGSVTCIDLSKKRSLVNAYRHEEEENITIYVGNFMDVEQALPKLYDVITLIGVFEYGQGYIGGKTPYHDFLKIIKRHLKPDGQIWLAIENKFGMKYWAGCSEDHYGTYFSGIEDYPETGTARTFSRDALLKIAKECGLRANMVYYPYPDYKLPSELFSDEYLPEPGQLKQNQRNFDRDRMLMFDEGKAFDMVIREGKFPEYSNSFLFVLEQEEQHKMEKVIYAKLSNDRDEKFHIQTLIFEENGTKKVVKKPDSAAAVSHVAAFEKYYGQLSAQYEGSCFEMNRCHMEQGAAVFEYIDGKSLEETADGYLTGGEKERAAGLLLDVAEKLHGADSIPFENGSRFAEVFGNIDTSAIEGKPCGACADVDLILPNILVCGSRWVIIDYEWTFDFPIPTSFIVYRLLRYYIKSTALRQQLDLEELCEKAGIEPKELGCYERMEEAFQNYIDGSHISLRELYDTMGKRVVDARDCCRRELLSMQVFYDRGAGCSEKDSYRIPSTHSEAEFDLAVPIPPGVKMVRLDPMDEAGIVMIHVLRFKNKEKAVKYNTNGRKLFDQVLVFEKEDPMLLIPCEGEKELQVRLRVEKMSTETLRILAAMEAKKASAQNEKGLFGKKRSLRK